MYLSASKDTRSKIDITTFPSQFKGDLDSTWVSIREGRRANKQPRDQPDTFMTPPKKVRSSDVEYLSPIVKNVNNVPISEMNTQVIIPNLKSFGYKCSQVIESALMKSIRRALRKRDIYINNCNLDPSIRANKITAMRHSSLVASRKRDEIVLLIRKIGEDLTREVNVDSGKPHPLLTYILGRQDDDDQVSSYQLSKIKTKLLTVRDLLTHR